MKHKITTRIITQYQLRIGDQLRYCTNCDEEEEPKARIANLESVKLCVATGTPVQVLAVDKWKEVYNQLGECLSRTSFKQIEWGETFWIIPGAKNAKT